MARILTTCPTSGEMVPTGHRTSELDVAEMSAPRSFRCSTCQQVHTWTAGEAIIEKTQTLSDFRTAA